MVGIGAIILLGSGVFWGTNYYLDKKQIADLANVRKAALSDFFTSFSQNGLIPIVLPAAQAVGSVYDAKNGNWIDTTANCFPKLQVPPRVASSLPSVNLTEMRRGTVGLGFEKIVTGSLKPESIRSIKIEFSNVEILGVSQQDLIRAYAVDSCRELQQVFESVNSGNPPAPLLSSLFVIRELYIAKRKLVVDVANKRDAQEAASAADSEVEAQVEDHGSGQFSLILQNNEPLPVAAKPAFLPVSLGVTLGSRPTSETETVWMPFDVQLDPGALDVFRTVMKPGFGAPGPPRR
jgi:hypothetical protein